MPRLVVISAGLSTPSSTRNLSDQLAGATATAITARGEQVETTTIELRDLAVDMAQAMVSAGGVVTPALAAAQEAVTSADGLILVTPVFTAGYSGLFKMFFDLLDTQAIDGTPTLIGATAGTPGTPSCWTTRSARYLATSGLRWSPPACSQPQKTSVVRMPKSSRTASNARQQN